VARKGAVLESGVTKRLYRKADLKFLRKPKKRYGNPEIIATAKLRSYGAAIQAIGNSFRQMRGLQKCAAAQPSSHHHFNQDRHPYSRANFKLHRPAALAEWRGFVGRKRQPLRSYRDRFTLV
jgi:putative transposase